METERNKAGTWNARQRKVEPGFIIIKSPGPDLGFPKGAPKAQASSGVRDTLPQESFWIFTPYSPLPRVPSHSERISTWEVFLLKDIFVMKNVTDFGKNVETGVDPRLVAVKLHVV